LNYLCAWETPKPVPKGSLFSFKTTFSSCTSSKPTSEQVFSRTDFVRYATIPAYTFAEPIIPKLKKKKQ